MQNNCDGSGPHTEGTVRVLPTGPGKYTSNSILCPSCFNREIAWRKERNFKLSKECQFDIPKWNSLKVYGDCNGYELNDQHK